MSHYSGSQLPHDQIRDGVGRLVARVLNATCQPLPTPGGGELRPGFPEVGYSVNHKCYQQAPGLLESSPTEYHGLPKPRHRVLYAVAPGRAELMSIRLKRADIVEAVDGTWLGVSGLSNLMAEWTEADALVGALEPLGLEPWDLKSLRLSWSEMGWPKSSSEPLGTVTDNDDGLLEVRRADDGCLFVTLSESRLGLWSWLPWRPR